MIASSVLMIYFLIFLLLMDSNIKKKYLTKFITKFPIFNKLQILVEFNKRFYVKKNLQYFYY